MPHCVNPLWCPLILIVRRPGRSRRKKRAIRFSSFEADTYVPQIKSSWALMTRNQSLGEIGAQFFDNVRLFSVILISLILVMTLLHDCTRNVIIVAHQSYLHVRCLMISSLSQNAMKIIFEISNKYWAAL